MQVGKKAIETIFADCPLVTGLPGRKYGLFPGDTQGSGLPHTYPPMAPFVTNASIHVQKVDASATSSNVCWPVGGAGSPFAEATILEVWPLVMLAPGLK